MGERRVGVLVVTYNAADTIDALLNSLVPGGLGPATPVVVVDNGSTDATREVLRRREEVQLVEQHNTGFAHGVNRGISELGPGLDVLVLNADVRLGEGALDRLVDQLLRNDDVAVVVPRVLDGSCATAPSLRRRPTVWHTLLEAVVGGTRAGRYGERYFPVGDVPQDVDWATGAAMLLRSEAIAQLGPLSESYFLYSEETEYCLRAGMAGWRVVCEPKAAVVHAGGSMATDPRLWALRAVNRVRLHQRQHGRLAGAGMRVASVAFEVRRVLAGQATSRSAVRCLLQPDLDRVARRLTVELGGDTGPMER